MKKYQKYIALTYLSSFIRTLLFLSSIIISIKTLNIAQKLTEDSPLNLKSLIAISFHIIPYVLYTVAPFASAIAAVNVFNSLLSSSQITVLQNAMLTNARITASHMFVTVPIAVLMLYFSSFILPKTAELRYEVQDSIIQQKMRNFLTPDTIKTFGNLTIITSPRNILKHIPITLIHQKTANGEFVFVGNIQETWSVNKMIGINANNATILTISPDGETLVKFQTLESQIDFFPEEELRDRLDYISTINLIKMYKKSTIQRKIIKEINKRIMPSILIIILPFALITLLIRYHNSRTKMKAKHVLIIIVTTFYILFSCYNMIDIFKTIYTFPLVYLNILLTFLLVYFLGNHNIFKKKRKHV